MVTGTDITLSTVTAYITFMSYPPFSMPMEMLKKEVHNEQR